MPSATIPTLTTDDLREFLMSLPGLDPARIEEGLRDPQGLQAFVEGIGTVAFVRIDSDRFEIIENPDRKESAIPKEKRMKQSLPPTLIIVPLIRDAKSPTPLGPKKALTLTQEILLKRGTIIAPTNKEPFHGTQAEIDEIVTKALAANPGARLAKKPTPMRRYIGQEPNEVIAKACSEDPSFRAVETTPQVIVKTGATPVERLRIAGTISKESYRESIASSEAQAQEVADRIRAKQASEGNFMPAQRSDGSYYGPDGRTPHEPLSMTRRPADRDAAPGVGPISYKKAEIEEMGSFHKKIVTHNAYRRCATEGCQEWVSSIGGRTRCPAHCYKS